MLCCKERFLRVVRCLWSGSAIWYLWCVLLAVSSASTYAETASLFMWKASTKQGEILYLLGSLHYATNSCYPMPDEIQRAYETASTVGIEVDLSKPQSAET